MHNFIKKYSDFILNETLKTHDIGISISNINRELSLQGNINFSLFKENNNIKCILHNFNYNQSLPLMFDYINNLFIDRHGWFPSIMNLEYLSGKKSDVPYDEDFLVENSKYISEVSIIYEGKYDLETSTLTNVLYHLSIQEYEKNILKFGLIPKSKSKLSKHLDRIYLSSNLNDCYNLITKMKWYYIGNIKEKNKINIKWVIYEIDTKELKINLYKDPNSNGYYTIDNIPSKI
jgi:hypothetical protein